MFAFAPTPARIRFKVHHEPDARPTFALNEKPERLAGDDLHCFPSLHVRLDRQATLLTYRCKGFCRRGSSPSSPPHSTTSLPVPFKVQVPPYLYRLRYRYLYRLRYTYLYRLRYTPIKEIQDKEIQGRICRGERGRVVARRQKPADPLAGDLRGVFLSCASSYLPTAFGSR